MTYLTASRFISLLIGIILLMVVSKSAWSCDERLKNFPTECQLQKRYKVIKSSFKRRYDMDIEQLATYRALRFIAHHHWVAKKKSINYLPWYRYDPKPVTWMFWERGVAEANELFSGPLTLTQLKKVHREIIDPAIIRAISLRKGAFPGKIRSRFWQRAPAWKARCKSWPLNQKELDLLKNYDLKSIEGRPLVTVSKVKRCKGATPRGNGNFYRARIVYMKSPKVPANIKRFIKDFNRDLNALERGTSKRGPLALAADIQRRFVAIHPHGDGNGRIARLLQDYILKKFGLPFAPSGKLTDEITTPTVKYRALFKKVTMQTMRELEQCLKEHNERKVSGDCRSLKRDYPNENQTIKDKKRRFQDEMEKFLSIKNKDLKKYIKNNDYIGEVSKGKEEGRTNFKGQTDVKLEL